MADYDNAELATARRWWQNNAGPAIVGIIVGIVLIGGWYGYDWYQTRQSTEAAKLYAQVATGIQADNVTGGLVNEVDRLQDDYSGTPYAAAGAMSLARYYVQQDAFDKARQRLTWAHENANDAGIRAIAGVRAARVEWAQNNAGAALALLDDDHPASFDALYNELAGDIHMAQGDRNAAHKAYQSALDTLPQDVARQPLVEKASAAAPLDTANTQPSTSSDKTPS